MPNDVGQWAIARYIMRAAYCSRVKAKTFCRRFFAISFPKSRYGSPNFANCTIFEIFSKFNASFLSEEITQGDQTTWTCRSLTPLAKLIISRQNDVLCWREGCPCACFITVARTAHCSATCRQNLSNKVDLSMNISTTPSVVPNCRKLFL